MHKVKSISALSRENMRKGEPMTKLTPPKAPAYIIAFIEAVCPETPALYAASFSEKTCLTDATDLIVSLRARVAELEAQLVMADRAIGDHNAPTDCYATGPMTGDPIQDLVVCPACVYLNTRKGPEKVSPCTMN
jgi:hypothetical protein